MFKLFSDYYNNSRGLILISIIFIILMFVFGKLCPCNNDNKINKFCRRHEFYGVQINHLYFFILLGLLFPSYFFTILIFGILWELLEYYIDKYYTGLIIKYNIGCLSPPPDNLNNNLNNYYVYKNIQKYINPIDKYFNINPSQIHGWHPSIAEIIPNIVGFILGYILNKLITKYYNKN